MEILIYTNLFVSLVTALYSIRKARCKARRGLRLIGAALAGNSFFTYFWIITGVMKPDNIVLFLMWSQLAMLLYILFEGRNNDA